MAGVLWWLIDPFGLLGDAPQTVAGIIEYVLAVLESYLAPPACQLLSALDAVWVALNIDGVLVAVGPWLAAANVWLPLSEAFVVITAYLTFVAAFSIIKLLVKFIPTIG